VTAANGERTASNRAVAFSGGGDDAAALPRVAASGKGVAAAGSGTGPGTSTVTVPAIEFEVAGDDGPIVLDRVFPTPASGNTAWAAAIVARYEPGQQTTGWAPPGRLDETFLVRDWALDPYFAIVFAGGCLAILMAITSLATFFLPPVSRATAGVGIVAPLAIAAWTAWHLWSNVEPDARPDDAWQVGVTVGILIAAILPLLARRQAARWMTRLLRSREADATGAGAFDATR